jgi:hypothetical protein
MVLSAFIVVLLIGASYRGDPSADGPAKRSAPQTISFAPSEGGRAGGLHSAAEVRCATSH